MKNLRSEQLAIAREKSLQFLSSRAQKLDKVRTIQTERQAKANEMSNAYAAKLERSEKIRAEKKEALQAERRQQILSERQAADERRQQRRREYQINAVKKHEALRSHADAVAERLEKRQKEKEQHLKRVRAEAVAREAEAAERRAEMIERDRQQRIAALEKHTEQTEARSMAQLQSTQADRRFKNELQKLKFENRRVHLRRDKKKRYVIATAF